MSSIDQQFVEFVVKSLVSKPDEVNVERRIDEKGVLLELTVDPEDLGRVIGKRGATAQSIRTLLRALGTKNDARYNLKIIDNGVQQGPRSTNGSDRVAAASDNRDDSSPTDDSMTPVTDDSTLTIDQNEPDEVDTVEDNRISRTRKELEELDDLDV
jgi:predicted RNA-binding protein YlqC (UPF0109 family)